MGIDVYFRRDIANVLRATACASEGSAGLAAELLGEPLLSNADAEKILKAYQEGTRRALVSVGLAFGLEAAKDRVNPGGAGPLAGLLWAEAPQDR